MGLFGKKPPKQAKRLTDAEIYLNYMEHMFGPANVIRRMEAPAGPAVHVFFYRDLPESGMLTAITYGLSTGSHPEWRSGKCELMVSLNTQDEGWGLAAAFFAAQFRNEKSFSYGSLFTLDEPITQESAMSGFLVFAPSFLEPHQSALIMPDYKIYLKGLYPIYPEETAVYNAIGLEQFWHHPNFNMYDVNRPRITLDDGGDK